MKCDRCGQPATINEVTIRHGKRVERHWCEACAAASGMVAPGGPNVTDLLGHLIQPPIAGPGGGAGGAGGAGSGSGVGAGGAGAGQANIQGGLPGFPPGFAAGMVPPGVRGQLDRCPRCSATMAQLRDTGLLGCPVCYEAFLPQLLPLIQRFHEGGGDHRGKRPKRMMAGEAPAPKPKKKTKPAPDPEMIRRRIEQLRRDLTEALAQEDYRAAALLRDALIQLGDDQFQRPDRDTTRAGGEP
jgi:protein-arginine kinase activator protein McsA